MRDYLLNSVVTVRRNYADLHFNAAHTFDTAQRVNERAAAVMEQLRDGYQYMPLSAMNPDTREAMKRQRLLTRTAEDAQFAACYLRQDGRVCVLAAAEDHVIVSAAAEGAGLQEALHECRVVEREIKNTGRIAMRDGLGFLTTRASDTGIGVRASVLLHLPLIRFMKQAEKVAAQMTMKGYVFSPLHPNTGLCILENRSCNLFAEEACEQLLRIAQEICTQESTLRDKVRETGNIVMDDVIYRARATAKAARLIQQGELLSIWSALTIGSSLGVIQIESAKLETIWQLAYEDDSILIQEARSNGAMPEQLRAERVRSLLYGGNERDGSFCEV